MECWAVVPILIVKFMKNRGRTSNIRYKRYGNSDLLLQVLFRSKKNTHSNQKRCFLKGGKRRLNHTLNLIKGIIADLCPIRFQFSDVLLDLPNPTLIFFSFKKVFGALLQHSVNVLGNKANLTEQIMSLLV